MSFEDESPASSNGRLHTQRRASPEYLLALQWQNRTVTFKLYQQLTKFTWLLLKVEDLSLQKLYYDDIEAYSPREFQISV